MQLHDYVRVLRRGWPIVVALTLVGLLVGWFIAAVQRPVYVATAKAYVAVASAANAGDLINSAQYTQQIAASFANIAGTSYVLRPVIARLRLDETPAELADSVTVTAAATEAVLTIQATDASPTRAARIANAVAERLTTAVASLTPAGGRVDVTVVDPAVSPTVPASPIPLLDLGVGAGAGVVLGLLLAALRILSDTRLRTARDIAATTSVPILAALPWDPAARRGPVVMRDGPQGPLAESVRSLRAALQFLDIDQGAQSIVVTSSVESEGKSLTAVNLAVALAETGERVLLVDADLRRPAVAGLLGLEGAVGLTDVLIDRSSLGGAVQTAESGLLAVLPSGAVPPNPNELLQSRSFERLLTDLEARYDRVVIDAPPILLVSDAAILAHRASGALLVVGSGRVKRAQLRGALDVFRQTRAPVLGIVLTMLPLRETNAGTAGGSYRHAGGGSRSSDATLVFPELPQVDGDAPSQDRVAGRSETRAPQPGEPIVGAEPAEPAEHAAAEPTEEPADGAAEVEDGTEGAAEEPTGTGR